MNISRDDSYLVPLLVFIVYYVPIVKTEIFWVLRQPAIFGQDVKLFCNASGVDNCCTSKTQRWNGGPEQRTVTRNTVSSNNLKYVSVPGTDGFSLIVKHFSAKDVNIRYTCSYGREQYANILKMDSGLTKYPKDIKTISFTNTEKEIYFKIKLTEVYPEPKCTAALNKKKMNSSVIITSTRTTIFYDTIVVLEDSFTVTCGMLEVACTVATKVFTTEENITDNCTRNYLNQVQMVTTDDNKKTDAAFTPLATEETSKKDGKQENQSLPIIFSCIISGIVTASILGACIIYKRRKSETSHTRKESENDSFIKENPSDIQRKK